MDFSPEEINYWEARISGSGDVDIIRRFFNRIGKPEKTKKVLEKRVKELAEHDVLLQREYSKGYFNPELSQKEVREIARGTIKKDIAKHDVGALSKLCYPVFKMEVPDEQMRLLVNKAIREGNQGYRPGEDPVSFSEGLIEFPVMHECPEEVSYAFSVFAHRRYNKFVEEGLARNIVTLKIFHNLLLGDFGEASKLKKKYAQNYDEAMLREMTSSLVAHPSFTENYGEGYIRAVAKSQWKVVFPEMALTECTEEGKPMASDSEILSKAFDEAEGNFTVLCGIRDLNQILGSKAFVNRFGHEKIKQVLEERVQEAIEKGKAAQVYMMFYGENTRMMDGEEINIPGIKALPEYVTAPEDLTLLEKMVGGIRFTPKVLLSDEDSFRYDNFSRDKTDIENAYALSQKMLVKGTIPPNALMQDLIFLKMAAHAKETYMGNGAKNAIEVYTKTQNKPFIDDTKIKALWHKVVPAIVQSFVPGYLLMPDCVSYCLNLVDSPLGKLVEDIPALKPYLKLREFLKI